MEAQELKELHPLLQQIVEHARRQLGSIKLERFDAATAPLFDISVLYNTSITVDHTDVSTEDGPGHVLCLVNFNGDGMVIFVGEEEESLFTMQYLGVNQWLVFTDDMRYGQTHQVTACIQFSLHLLLLLAHTLNIRSSGSNFLSPSILLHKNRVNLCAFHWFCDSVTPRPIGLLTR